MEQGGDVRGVHGERDMNQNQPLDQRLLNEMQQGGDMQQAQVQSQRPQQPQQCPRCNSINTKFCYYNNYNVTQPRHYCKTCRRYWTQGGTLRNIPVGGGCHKRKHAKNSSSSRSQQPQPSPPLQEVVVQRQQLQLQPPPPPQDVVVQTHQSNLKAMVKATKDPCLMVAHSTNPIPFYQDGDGYFSSLPTFHSMNQSQSSHYDQSFKIGVDLAGSSNNLGLAPGFNVGSLASQRHVFQMGGREREVRSQYMPQQGFIIPSTMTTIQTSVPVHTDCPQSFINNVDNRTCDASLWSTISNSTTSISGNIDRSGNVVGSSPLVQNEWSHFPGYGPPPSSY